jgi:RNA polymerase sigma-70 factor (ECF subfamily)
MVNVLACDAILYADGGGKAHAARIPIEGADRIAKFLHGLATKTKGAIEVRPALVNGRTGALNYLDGHLVSVLSVLIEDGQSQRMFIVMNPDKLPREVLTL